MNHKRLIASLLLAGTVLLTAGFINDGGPGPIQHLVDQLTKWTDNYPVEKVYLQLDKPYYAVGDDIWFKGYVTIGPKHQLSDLSNILNVELLDDRDSVKQRIKLPLRDGFTWGDFALSDTLPEGNYRIRAYTNWMRNFGDEYFFDKVITVVNSASNKVFTTSTYSYSTVNGKQQVTAVINYTDINGITYINRPVRYTIDLGLKSLLRGKGVTDSKGNLTVSFISQQDGTGSGMIATAIDLGNKEIVTKNVLIKATSGNVDLQFFPESGYLVNTVNCKVAFKAVGSDGLGVDVKGTITDDQNNTIATFSSQHLGMGVFRFEPQAGRTYKANVTFADGSVKTYALPTATDKGYVLSIDNSDENTIGIKISSSRSMTAQGGNTDTLSLIAQEGGHVYYAAKTKPGVTTFTASVDKDRFPSGIVQFTLFSSKGEPLNERLIFVQNPDQMKLDISTAKQTYAPREKVKFSLNAKDAGDKPVVGSFSVSVINETQVPVNEDEESTILSSLLLTSDLKGYVEKPNYYFNSVNDKTQADLDVLMLTQGYRRFEWKKIANDEFPPITFQPEKSLQVSGTITTFGGKPVVNGKVSLVSTKQGFFYMDTVTDEHGHFTFGNLVFGDSIRFIVQARTSKDHKNVQIDLDNMVPRIITTGKNAPDMRVNINTGLSAYLQSSKQFHDAQVHSGMGNHSIVLKEVVISDTHHPKLKYSDNLNGPGNADQVLMAKDLPSGCVDITQCLAGRLLGVMFSNGKAYSSRGGQMNFLVDGLPMSSMDMSTINANDIASIEVLRSVSYFAIYGSEAGPGGLIIITMKRGSDVDDEAMSRPAPGIITFSPIGYYKSRVFYSPDYNDPKNNKEVADLRTTVFWKPNLITGKDGNTSFEYFNAGSKGTYRVVVEGIDSDGNIGRRVLRYKVE